VALESSSITSNPCALLVEGITLKFQLTFGCSPSMGLENSEIVLLVGSNMEVYWQLENPTSSQEQTVKISVKISY